MSRTQTPCVIGSQCVDLSPQIVSLHLQGDGSCGYQFEDYQHPCKGSCDSGMGAPALTGPIHWEPNSAIRQEVLCGCRYGLELIISCHQILPSWRSPKSSEYSREWWQKPFTSFILQSNNNYCSAGGRAIAATRAEACLMYAACVHVTRLHNVND